jgi:hypothetical protein
MASSKLKQGLASVFQSEEQIFEQQKKYGRGIYWTAWGVEIGAALTGLYLALNAAYIAFSQGDQDQIAWLRAVGGALPFFIIAIIEPTKILLASGLYHAKPLGWRLLFFFGLVVLTLVTFETMYGGLVTQNVNVSKNVQRIQNSRSDLLTELTAKGNDLSLTQMRTKEYLLESVRREEETARSERDKEIQNAETQFQLKEENITKAKGLERAAEGETTTGIDGRLGRVAERRQGAEESHRETLNNIQSRYSAKRTARQDRLNKLEETIADDGFLGASADLRATAKREAEKIKSEIATLNSKETNEIDGTNIAHNKRLADYDKEEAGIRVSGGNTTKEKLALLDDRLEQARIARDKALELARSRYNEAIVSNEKKIASAIEESDANATKVVILNADIEDLISEDGKLKAKYRQEAANLFPVQLTKTLCGWAPVFLGCISDDQSEGASDDPIQISNSNNVALEYVSEQIEVSATIDIASIPQIAIERVTAFWFMSIALIIASLGTFLAFTSFVLQDQDSYKAGSSTTFTNLMTNFGLGFRRAGEGVGSFLKSNAKSSSEFISSSALGFGKGIQSILQAVGSMFAIIGSSFRKMTLDIRRYVRAPKVKFQTIEKEVVVEKKVEVIVEREVFVEREVEVIVEKEKVVIKEVPKEVVRKEIVYVPLYSTENGKVLMDADLLTGSAEKTFRSKPGSSSENEET